MKTFLFAIAAIFYFSTAYSQDSCYKNVQDKFTNVVTWDWVDRVQLGNNVSVWVYAGGAGSNKTSFNLSFICEDIISVDENSSCTFLFTDGTKQKIRHSGGYNLSGKFFISHYDYKLGGGMRMLKEFLSKKIDAIRFDGFKEMKDIDLSDRQSEDLQKSLNCLYSAWKTERP